MPCRAPFPGCRLGVCVAPSCQGGGPGAGTDCGAGPGADCCGTASIPGGTFDRINAPVYPASVSDFRLDIYEITVGRFRAFVEAGKGTQADPPLPDAGAHPRIRESGWDSDWNSELTADKAAMKVALRCPDAFWTDFAEQNENHPMTCMTWFEAFAFCIWDGGRLPTEAEWNYAAAGGAEQRLYPWGASIDPSKAAYECYGDGDRAAKCSMADFLPVGSKSPDGDARWGMADMAGNAGELVLDMYEIGFPTPCHDCARLEANTEGRIVRGGTAWTDDLYVATDAQSAESPRNRNAFLGARCARDLVADLDP
ncbi:formylglycine-generating enzyme family protein [Sorangium cellulosum]|uniref:formylglycine-generating enzyme family protein n=1 Tax=Sorangium TaxID=39643 RepID=UPI003B968240